MGSSLWAPSTQQWMAARTPWHRWKCTATKTRGADRRSAAARRCEAPLAPVVTTKGVEKLRSALDLWRSSHLCHTRAFEIRDNCYKGQGPALHSQVQTVEPVEQRSHECPEATVTMRATDRSPGHSLAHAGSRARSAATAGSRSPFPPRWSLRRAVRRASAGCRSCRPSSPTLLLPR